MTSDGAAADRSPWLGDAGGRALHPQEWAVRASAFERTERAAQIGSWCWAPLTDEMSWSDNAFRLFGLEPGEITPSRHWVRRHTHPDDRQRLRRAGERLRRGTRMSPLEFRSLQSDEDRFLRLIVTAVQQADEAPGLIFGIVRDVTDQRRAEHEADARVGVSEALAAWDTLEHGAPRMLHALAQPLAFEVATLWVVRGDALVVTAVWHVPSSELARFERVARQSTLARGAELPGQAWAMREPVGTAGGAEPRTAREDAAAAAGMPPF